jgi:hypothetical protein
MRHGVAPLLASACPAHVRPALAGALRGEAVRAVARDGVMEAALRTLTGALADAGVEALVFKGADLAYSCYSQSHLRPRTDSDILVAPAAHSGARQVLERLGYSPVAQSGGDLLMYQEPFVLRAGGRVLHVVDLHWRAANPQSFGDSAPFETLWAESEGRPRLGPAARGLAPVHAFTLSCVHRVAHHYDDDRLIWIHDLHRLAGRMAPADWSRLMAWAPNRGAAAACARGIALVTSLFETPIPDNVHASLVRSGNGEPHTHRYLGRRHRHVDRILADLALTPTWSGRARLARQHVFPPRSYMRDVYAPGSGLPVAMLYVQRAWRGARRWIART